LVQDDQLLSLELLIGSDFSTALTLWG